MVLLRTILSTIGVLGVLIFVHELGHFLVAKWAGVTVLRFSLGFGPRVFGFKRGDTDYCLSLVPLGGYVKMLGEEPDEEVTEEQMANSFGSKPVSKRMLIVLAGPLSNLILAIVIFTMVHAFSGIHTATTEIGTITKDSPAEKAGLQTGDVVLTINSKEMTSWDELSQTIEQSGEEPIHITFKRGDEIRTVQVSPRVSEYKNLFGETTRRPLIGVGSSGKYTVKKVDPISAAYYGFLQTWNLSKLFAVTIVKLIQRAIPFQTLGGPILIAQMAGQQAQEGLLNLIYFTAIISVNLAVLNLLPIPILDGGHILFFLIEAILGRPIEVKKIETAQKVGMLLLLVLMVCVFYNDIMRLIPGHKPDFMP